MTDELKIINLGAEELSSLYERIFLLRNEVLNTIQKYGYNVNELVTRKIEHDIEMAYGKLQLEIIHSFRSGK